mgnify:FL=1
MIYKYTFIKTMPETHEIVDPCRQINESSITPSYPAIDCYKSDMLKVCELHTIYWECSGNPEGKPVLVLHGGPGGGCPPSYRTYFDPEKYNIIMFDQRGAGKSLPFAELAENTTWDLVAE